MRLPALPVMATAAAIVALAPGLSAQSDAPCLSCHAMATLGYRDSTARPRQFVVDSIRLHASAHAKIRCVDCHANAVDASHVTGRAATPPQVTCQSDCHATDSAGRPFTHAREAEQLRRSAHARARDADHPDCLSCHGAGDAHAVSTVSRAAPAQRMADCVRCHDDRAMMTRQNVSVDAVASYRRSFHSKAVRFGDSTTAGCPDCHNAHDVQPVKSASAAVSLANITKTCGKSACHEGAGKNFAVSGANHLDIRVAREPVLFLEQSFFLLLTAGTMAMLVVGILLDIQKKFGWLRLAGVGAAGLRRRWATLRPRVSHAAQRSWRLTSSVARRLLYD